MQTNNRHPAVVEISRWFHYDHLPEHLYDISKKVHDLAQDLVDNLEDGPQLTRGLQHLLEAKDCFVRQARADCDDKNKA